jgi:hypothetical protein
MDSSEKKTLKTEAYIQLEVYDNIASWLPDSSRAT